MDPTRYPIGIQSFETLINMGCAYVDKTRYIYDLAKSGSRIYFLSRPRRFGKSLLLSTMEAYFLGKRELFKGLDLYDLESEWVSYPVLHFDLSGAESTSIDKLQEYLLSTLQSFASKYEVELKDVNMGIGPVFGFLIKDISEKTGSQVVILIDEYDKGIIEVLDNEMQLKNSQDALQPFFSQIKVHDQYIRFCFITGVARFSHFTLFSGFNNPDDISLDEEYAALCGVTEDELIGNFEVGIKSLSDKLGLPHEEMIQQLRLKYDGYRFSSGETFVYNPFSILNCLKKKRMENYWIKSGTSKTFVKYLSTSDFQLTKLEDLWCNAETLESTFSNSNPIPLLFQSGYLSIQDYRDGLYKLGIPNGEVKSSLVNELLPKFMGGG